MKKANKWLSLLLAFAMVLALIPSTLMPVYAAYEDGDECWNCGHYHWDEYMHECGACSPDCTNDWCALETHCHRCGGCLNGDYPCDECGLCKECMAEIGHCSQCDMCWMDYGGDDVLCGNCRRCEFCSPICPECGMCEECAGDSSDGMHCPECGNCYQVTEQCMFVENNHCKDCCEPCEQCGECIAGDHLETCDDCGLCVQCCEFNSMMAGCESGEICVDSADWIDCICEGCGEFFENQNGLCDTCLDAGVVRCPDCCELASECSEKMCEYNDEYEDHFCIDCGSCFHDVTLCDTCAGAGELRCEDCCENLTNSLGCDGSCGDVWCSNDTYFEQHLEEEREDHPDFDNHDAFPSNRWSHDKNSHWRECLSDSASIGRHFKTTRSVMHTFGDPVLLGKSAKAGATDYDKVYEKTCTACGYKTYYETHQHVYHTEESDFEKYNRGSFQVDEEKTTNMAHALVCLVDDCGHIKMESHEWNWRHGAHGSDEDGGGMFYRECRICEYPDYDYRPVDEGGNKINWTTENVLVTAINAQVSRTLAEEGDRLTLTINDNSDTQGKRCIGWTVEYIDPDERLYDITSYYDIVLKDGSEWNTTVKLAGCKTGGYLIFTPTMVDCTSHEYVTEGYAAPVCMYDGFAGYRICKHCHTADPTDTRSDEERIISATGTAHTGTKQPLYQKEVTLPSGKKTITWTTDKSESNGKRYNYKEGNCTEKGCEGDFLCSACERVIPGKWDYKHPSMHLVTRNQSPFSCFKNGYSGDDYCELCGKLVNKGYVIEAPKKHETLLDVDGSEIAATCTVSGKEADQWCLVCNEVFSGKTIPALGHSWVKDEAGSTETTTAYKCDRAGCTATKFADIITEAHAVKVHGGAALVDGKAVKKAAEGTIVTLKLSAVPEGKLFKEWEVISGGVVLTNATEPDGAAFTMGALDVEINAVLEDVSTYHNILVVNGTASIGEGSMISGASEGTVVTITADPAEAGKQFDKWEVIYGSVTIADANSAVTTFTMGSDDVKVRANYKDSDPSHTHTYDDTWKSDDTEHWKECTDTDCPDITGSVKDKAAHTATDWIVDAAATETEDGVKHKECTVCHKVLEIATIPTTGGEHTHVYGDSWKSDEENHWHECECGVKDEIAAHTESDWIVEVEATAVTEGSKYKECTVCKRRLAAETIPVIHTHIYDTHWKADTDNHWHECECGDKAELAAHTFVWKTDKEATETEIGLEHEECTVCGFKRNENTVIDKLPDGGSTGSDDNAGNTDNSGENTDKPAEDEMVLSPNIDTEVGPVGHCQFFFIHGGSGVRTVCLPGL